MYIYSICLRLNVNSEFCEYMSKCFPLNYNEIRHLCFSGDRISRTKWVWFEKYHRKCLGVDPGLVGDQVYAHTQEKSGEWCILVSASLNEIKKLDYPNFQP